MGKLFPDSRDYLSREKRSCLAFYFPACRQAGQSGSKTYPEYVCDSGATRTLDPQLRRLLLYPTELRNRNYGAKIHFFSIYASYCDFIKLTSPFFSIICRSLSGRGSNLNFVFSMVISPLSKLISTELP